jgi:haloalkane dehalogenase
MSDTTAPEISAEFPFEKKSVSVLGSRMTYVDVGKPGKIVTVFLHGNPTSSYMWRNIIPPVEQIGVRCIAPDLIGLGDSDKVPTLQYRVKDHQRYVDAFLDAVLPTEKIVFILHDWGTTLGFEWSRRHESRVAGLAFWEFVSPIPSWDIFPDFFTAMFKKFREPEEGRKLLIDENAFVERVLPSGIVRKLSEAEMTHYRAPFLKPEYREPLYRFPNDIPIEGKPADMWEMAKRYTKWLVETEVPKLFFWASPGAVVPEAVAQRFIRDLRNTRSVALGKGIHYLSEDYPDQISREIAAWLPTLSAEK